MCIKLSCDTTYDGIITLHPPLINKYTFSIAASAYSRNRVLYVVGRDDETRDGAPASNAASVKKHVNLSHAK